MFRRLLFFITAAGFLVSCEKAEKALVLPPPGTATHATIEMGEKYGTQVFFDFETGAQVFASSPACWDLAFEASVNGRHVFMNGGNKVFVYNTHKQDMRQVTALPYGLSSSGIGWQFDDPSGLPDQTGIGEWCGQSGTKSEVYIVMTAPDVYQKMRILSVSSSSYSMEWLPLNDTGTATRVVLPKDTAYNYVYFSFSNGIVKPDPPKATWDVVFTRYRYIYRDYPIPGSDFPYEVTGVLLNPTNTLAAEDSTTPFADITLQSASALPTSNHRDVIGFDWKGYDIGNVQYTVNRARNYIIHTRKFQMYKMHFLDFYKSGAKGNPLFEYERLK